MARTTEHKSAPGSPTWQRVNTEGLAGKVLPTMDHSSPTSPGIAPLSPGHAYAALCGLSTVDRPSRWQQARMRMLARYLLDAAAAERREVAA